MSPRLMVSVLGAAAVFLAAGCTPVDDTSGSPSERRASPATSVAPGDCPVTRPSPGAIPSSMQQVVSADSQPVPWIEGWHGNDALWVGLPPESSVPAQPARDKPGWLATKFPWWRLLRGDLAVRATRLDGPGEFRASVPNGAYGGRGFIPSGLYWSTPGCWRLTAEVAGKALTLTVRVEKRPLMASPGSKD